MPTVLITRDALAAIRGMATLDFIDTSSPGPDGLRRIPLDRDTVARLASAAMPGETLSDVVTRLAAYRASNGRTN
jgi:hypothetical protein